MRVTYVHRKGELMGTRVASGQLALVNKANVYEWKRAEGDDIDCAVQT